jgi:Heavy metal binding domain/Barrel-sandwich domain of CusB or HlyD membrane-fusion
MTKKTAITLITVLAAAGFWSSKLLWKKNEGAKKAAFEKVEGTGYWTCPMHPQIHSDHSGECPICHMNLVKVKAQAAQTAEQEEAESRSPVFVSAGQRQLLGIQKVAAEKMDLTVHLPVSGRLLSGATVAFQVYESDLKRVRPGLTFTGSSSYYPEAEISGVITSVDNLVDPTSRTVRVLGSIRNGARGLISETTFSGDIALELKGVLAVPESAVLHTGHGDLVYTVAEDGSLNAQPVKLGLKTESYYEVLEGLSAGQFLSSGPNFLIDSEAKIRGTSGHTHH